jgi:hypothetical protein
VQYKPDIQKRSASASPKAFPERNFKRQTTPTIDFGKYGGVGTEPHPEKE